MNYIKCFSRSRSAKNLQTVFCLCARLVSRWHQARSIATAAHLRPSGVPLASGKEYCHGCTFAPVWCPRWYQARSIATDAHLRPFWCPRWHQARSIATDAHLRPFWVYIPSYYTHYSKSQKLEFWKWCPLLATRYRLYRVSQILGNCKQM